MKPASAFSWHKRRLVSGDVRLHLYPRCKECCAREQREYRERMGEEEMRRRTQKYEAQRRHKRQVERLARLPAVQEFIDWYYAIKSLKVREAGGENIHLRMGFENSVEMDNFERSLRRGSATLNPKIVDQILTATGYEDRLAVFWSVDRVVSTAGGHNTR